MCCMLFLRFGLQCMGAADWMGWCRPVGAWDALRVNIGVCFSRRWVFDGDVDRTRSGGGGGGGGGAMVMIMARGEGREGVVDGQDKDVGVKEGGEQGGDVIGEGVVGVEEENAGAAHVGRMI